ncbi:MAG: ABC transporter permease [Planctomycetota bacterium]
MLTPLSPLGIALRALLRRRLRSALSAIGVTCGVAALVAMLAVADGARGEILQQIERLGAHTVSLKALPDQRSAGEKGAAQQRIVDRLRGELPGLAHLAPVVEVAAVPLGGSPERPPTVVGTTHEFFRIRQLEADRGRVLGQSDVARRSLVCVLGAAISRDLAGLGRVGSRLACGIVDLEVVGVLGERGRPGDEARMIESRDIDRCVFLPYTSVASLGGSESQAALAEVALAFRDREHAIRAGRRVTRSLTERDGEASAFEVVVPAEILAQASRAQRVFSAVLAAVALISLIVGGVGIMNIMLVSVAERTAEIGLRQALGATRAQIGLQFLLESLLLTVGGALLGIAGGVVGAELISRWAGWTVEVRGVGLALALGMALLVGLCSGLYPARRAALLHPIVALRSH